ncbi:hypothetical protein HDU96_006073 [Phlyctochytrium bullatum]|nr:hypothetical protein HDU96_006073 [Phlyctochytrium bullatum]
MAHLLFSGTTASIASILDAILQSLYSSLSAVSGAHASPGLNGTSDALNSTTFGKLPNWNTLGRGRGATTIKNELFDAGLALLLVAALIQWVSQRWSHFSRLVMDPYTVRVVSDTNAFTYVAEYLADHPHILSVKLSTTDWIINQLGRSARSIRNLLRWRRATKSPADTVRSTVCMAAPGDGQTQRIWYEESPASKGKPAFMFVPDNGRYHLRFGAHVLEFQAFEKEMAPTAVGAENLRSERQQPERKKCFAISDFEESGEAVREFVRTAVEYYHGKHANKVNIYAVEQKDTWRREWRKIAMRPPRSLTSLILRDGLMDEIIQDISLFLTSKPWYAHHGIPYRRGYLFHGPPGTGKTSTIFALAAHFKLDVCVANLNSEGMNDTRLQSLLAYAPESSVVVFEDVDVAFPTEEAERAAEKPAAEGDKSRKGNAGAKVTISGLLNALDGLAAQEGRLIFLTTNHLDHLPPALLRPGRCDRRFLFDYADAATLERLFIRFFSSYHIPSTDTPAPDPATTAALAHGAVAQLPPDARITAAQVQGFILRHRGLEPEEVVGRMEVLAEAVETERVEMEKERERKARRGEEEMKKAEGGKDAGTEADGNKAGNSKAPTDGKDAKEVELAPASVVKVEGKQETETAVSA